MSDAMGSVNLLGVLLAAISAFMVGGLWYSPLMFVKPWMRDAGITDDMRKTANMAKVFGGAFAFSLVAAYVFAVFLGPGRGAADGATAGFCVGLFWVAGSFGINYLFELRSFKLFLINGGYSTVQFTLYGAVLGYMQ